MFTQYGGYKGYKVTKHIERYIGYAKRKYERLSRNQQIELWDVLNGYDYIVQLPKCVQMFMYDMICEEFIHHGEYTVLRNVDGYIYVKDLNACNVSFANTIA